MASSAATSGGRGGRIVLGGQVIKALIQLASVIVLSRLLSPEDFGLVAMVAVAVSLGELLRDFGLSTAGLRAPQLSNAQASNLFWASSALGLVAGLGVTLSAPLLAALYAEPRLMAIAPALALALPLHGMQAQIQVQLARAFRYKALVVTDVAAQLVGLLIAIACILAGWGYWALVVQPVATALLLLMMRWLASAWAPSLPRRNVGSKGLITTGMNFGMAQILTFAANNTDTVMIGSLWGAGALGIYNRAFQLLTPPIRVLLSPLINVVVPTINSTRTEGGDVERMYIRIQSLIGAAIIGIFAIAAGSAASWLPLVLGPAWSEAVPIFQVLAVGGLALGLSQVSYWMFITEGDSRELLKYNLITKTMTVALVVIGSQHSVLGAAWAYSLALLISWPINIWWLGRSAGIHTSRFLINGGRILATGLITGTTSAVVTSLFLDENLWIVAPVSILCTVVLYIGMTALSATGRATISEAARVVFGGLREV